MIDFMLYILLQLKNVKKKSSMSTLCSFLCPLKLHCAGLPFHMTIPQILAESSPGTSQIPFLHLCNFPPESVQSLWAPAPRPEPSVCAKGGAGG